MLPPRACRDVARDLLVLRAQAGDADALDALLRATRPALVRHARASLGAAAADDVTQEALIAIVRGLHTLLDPERFLPWSHRIVQRRVANWLRSQRRRREAVERAAARLQPAASSGDGVELRGQIERLDPTARVVLTLRYLDGLEVREIADALEIPVGTVKSRLHHARSKLRNLLTTERSRP